MSSVARIKQAKRTLIGRHTRPDDVTGLTQALTTLAPLAALWVAVVPSAGFS
jgi:hypothetical protein